MLRRAAAVLGACALGALTPAAVAATTGPADAATTTGWVATATKAIPLTGLTDHGALAPSTPMRVSVALKLRNEPALRQDIAHHVTVTPAQFRSEFDPTPASTSAVESYLRSAGFTGVSASGNGVLVSASGTAARATSAFNTTLHAVSVSGRSAYVNTAPASVPSSLGGVVGSVLGLQTASTMHTATNPASTCVVSGLGYPCTYNPQGLQAAYDATSAPTGANTPIAIFAEGDLTQVIKDLRTEEAANGLPQVPETTVATGPASSDTSGADEWDLDTQYSTGMAQTVSNLYVYDATSLTDSDTAREFAAFVSNPVAKAGSASFGECEFSAYLDGSMLADDEAFAQAAAQGQTVFASAGDTGGFCPVAPNNGVPVGVPDVNYPASSPYVTAVGGTTLVTHQPGNTYNTETAWFAGGGGVSYFESAPAWQGGDGFPLASVLPTVCAAVSCGRTVPDVANDADPNSGANVYVDGTPTGVGGTSLSSPMTLGEWARMESADNNGLGNASPLFYKALGTPAFHDIVLGDTGPYPATPGYDLATGIGTLDVAQAVKTIG
jgi:pseudomonalisin